MRIMRATGLACVVLTCLLMASCDDGCDFCGERTNLVVANLTPTDAEISIDECQDGCFRYLGVVPAGISRKWEVDTGWAWVYIDGDAVEIYLDPGYDGWLEIREE
jgi:hypothetical protein